MNRNDIVTLLKSSDIRFRRVAIDEVVTTFPAHADIFFTAFHADDDMAVEMADAARQWMPLLRDGYEEAGEPFLTSGPYTEFRQLADFHLVFLDLLRKELSRLEEMTARKTVETMWKHFPGLRTDLDGFEESGFMYQEEPEEHRQLMVFVTGRCNLHCPYCFSKELEHRSVSRGDMGRVLTWAQRQGVESLLPCGGEPLMYENIDWLVREVELRGMKIYFATNLSVPLPAAMQKGGETIGQLHVHLTEEMYRDDHLTAVFRENLRRCREWGINVVLRGNITGESSYDDYDRWFTISKEYGIGALNVAFTIPSHRGSNKYVAIESISTMIPHLERVLKLGRENNVRVSMAKPVPLCEMPEEMAIDIMRHDLGATFCNVGEDRGLHNLSLGNDMRFSPCLGIDNPGVPFADDLKWETLKGLFAPCVKALQRRPLMERCKGCLLYHRRFCQGACLSYKQEGRKGGKQCQE